MKTAFLFPGQGSQKVGMGRSLFETHGVAREVFERADAALPFPISKLCFEGPEADLALTANTQPAILTASLAAFRVLEKSGCTPDFVAGHSLGEYSALVAGGALSLAEAVDTVRKRGTYMQAAVPVGEGAMAAILGLGLEAVSEACEEAADGEVVAPANINAPGQIVIAGHTDAVERAIVACKARGAKRGLKLPVSAPFHCALMMPAQERLASHLERVSITDPRWPLVNNVEARISTRGAECRDNLVRQVSAPVLWTAVVQTLAKEGVTTFVEVGPGTVLTGLSKKIVPDALLLNVEDAASADTVVAKLKGA